MIEIRRMQDADVEVVAAIEAQTFSQPWSRDAFLRSLGDNNMCFYVAVDKVAIGYIGICMAADEAEITNVAVTKEYRRQGIAAMLMKHAMADMTRQGIRRAFLEVRCSNRAAISLYEKLGFSISGIRKRFYRNPTEDAYLMSGVPDITTFHETD